VLALAALVMHGGLWVRLKTTGALGERASKAASRAWWAVIALTGIVTAVTFQVQPQVARNLKAWPLGYVFPLLAVAGAAGVRWYIAKRNERGAFLASAAFLTGMLTSVVFGVYPMVMPARDAAYSLTVANAQAGAYGLKIGLIWWVIGMILATGYFVFLYRSFAGKVSSNRDSHGYGE
jgi:cytochrome bd ubiquinol oxidase subunit II